MRTIPREATIVKEVEGFQIIHHPDPIFLQNYETGTTNLFKAIIEEGMVVLDIGAHLGYFTILASKLVGNEGRVYAFEPEPNNFPLLLEHIELNNCKNVIPSRMAICDKVGMAPLYLSSDSASHSLFVQKSQRLVHVETTTLDRYFEGRNEGNKVDFVKMDIEGSEMKALAGMENLLKENFNLILITEFLPEWLLASGCQPQEFIQYINEQGFSIYRIIEKSPFEIIPFGEGELSWWIRRTVNFNLLCVRGYYQEQLENGRIRKMD